MMQGMGLVVVPIDGQENDGGSPTRFGAVDHPEISAVRMERGVLDAVVVNLDLLLDASTLIHSKRFPGGTRFGSRERGEKEERGDDAGCFFRAFHLFARDGIVRISAAKNAARIITKASVVPNPKPMAVAPAARIG